MSISSCGACVVVYTLLPVVNPPYLLDIYPNCTKQVENEAKVEGNGKGQNGRLRLKQVRVGWKSLVDKMKQMGLVRRNLKAGRSVSLDESFEVDVADSDSIFGEVYKPMRVFHKRAGASAVAGDQFGNPDGDMNRKEIKFVKMLRGGAAARLFTVSYSFICVISIVYLMFLQPAQS